MFKETPSRLPEWLCHSALPPAVSESSWSSTASPALGVLSVLDFGHSDGSTVVSLCCFNLCFPDDL